MLCVYAVHAIGNLMQSFNCGNLHIIYRVGIIHLVMAWATVHIPIDH